MAEGSLDTAEGFGYAAIVDALRPQIAVMEDAHGDLVAAAEDLRLPQRRARQAREAEATGRRELAERFRDLGLIGRAIEFESGTSHATIRATSRGLPFSNPRETDLAGKSGIISSVEVGTVIGMPISQPDRLVMHVSTPGSLRLFRLPHIYVVFADAAQYSIGPDPDAPPQAPDAEPDVLPKVG